MITATSTMPPRTYRAVWFSGAVGAVLSVALAGWFWREARRIDQARFDQMTHQWVEYLDTHTEKVEGMLRELSRAMGGQTDSSTVVWDEFMDQASPTWNFPGVVAIGYSTNQLTGRVLEAMTPWLREQSPRERGELFTLQPPMDQPRQWNAWRVEVYRQGVRPAAPFMREDRGYSNAGKDFKHARFEMSPEVMTFAAEVPFEMRLTPRNGLQTILRHRNTDYVQDAVVREEVQISQGSSLLQRTNGTRLSLATMLAPVSHPHRREVWERIKPGGVLEELYERHWLAWQLNAGLVFACLDYDTLIQHIKEDVSPEVEVEIFSADPLHIREENRLTHQFGGRGQYRAAFERVHSWPMYGNRWSLVFRSTPAFDQRSTRDRAWWAGGLGLLTTGLFCWALALQIRGRELEARRAAELRDARNALQAAQKERERLSHDLHDGVIQSLYAIQLGFTRIESAVEAAAPATARQLAEGRANLDGVIGELREFLTDTQPADGRRPRSGLAAVLHSLVQRLQPASAVPIKLKCDAAAAARLTSAQAVQLTALAQEAISNSLRHAHAQNITVRLADSGMTVVLEVIDDGAGFDPADTISGRMGLVTMRRRAESLGAVLDLQTAPGRGTRIRVGVPVATELEPEHGDE